MLVSLLPDLLVVCGHGAREFVRLELDFHAAAFAHETFRCETIVSSLVSMLRRTVWLRFSFTDPYNEGPWSDSSRNKAEGDAGGDGIADDDGAAASYCLWRWCKGVCQCWICMQQRLHMRHLDVKLSCRG